MALLIDQNQLFEERMVNFTNLNRLSLSLTNNRRKEIEYSVLIVDDSAYNLFVL